MSQNIIASEIENSSGQVARAQPDGLADSLIRVNGLSYRMPSNMSVVVSRSLKRSYANLDQYRQNGKVIITLNSGSEYILGPTSYLTFDLQTVGAGSSATFESGSVTNIIDNVTINSVNGTEIDRVESVNLYNRNNDRWTYSQNYIDNFASVMGYKSSEAGVTNPLATVTDSPKRYCIPLSKLSPVHNNYVLMPSMMAGGLRYEIKLASYDTAFKNGVVAPSDYLISNVSIMVDSFQLADSIQKRLMMESANNGLEYHFTTYDRTRHNIVNSSKAFVTVRKAVSRALSAFAVTRLTNNVALNTEDSMASETNNVKRMFWRLGSLNFPNQPLFSKSEQYIYAQRAWKKMIRPHKDNSVSYDDFTKDEGLVAVDLERSSVLSLSGLPVNNSRQLQVEIDYDTATSRDLDVFMHYLSLARVFPTNILMKE